MRKVIAVRAGGTGRTLRYLSKNNTNIARLRLLATLFPDCTILVPFRNPADHAGSLARQHANFLARHAEDRFAQSYMEWIGHYEFGRAFRPLAFAEPRVADPEEPGYWLDYWDRAFRHILRDLPKQVVLIDYDALCAAPQRVLQRIADILEISSRALLGEARRFRPANHHRPSADPQLRAQARETHARLQGVMAQHTGSAL